MPSSEINDREILYRAIPQNPNMWKAALNRPSSAVFKDSRGVSVDRDGDRSERQVIACFDKRMPGRGIVSITAKICRDIGTNPMPKPEKDNLYHAEIHDNDGRIEIRRSKLKKLSSASKIVKHPNFS